ncbi:DUF4010 domain-containing protein [Roseomonas sp. AR75]|uniref:MgtC/SapB family protein n=1 Tax=Roseomonas sp. AR75 TaxID=2562311 RepID=UPI0010C0B796|nr:DUF4010 domain-containing protein [Roseomonas sp. AR75]
MEHDAVLHRLGIALAIGLLVGAERHWRERDAVAGHRTAGVRTFGTLGLLGGVAGILAAELTGAAQGLVLAGTMLAALGAVLPFALREAAADNSFSATTTVAAVATVALGALAAIGETAAAGAAAVALTAILASREALHGLLARITWAEMRSAILLLSMTLVALPLVPDAPIATLGGVNPAQVWRLAIVLAAVSFAGYLAMRLVGAERGLLLAGAAAGLVSSTAVTLSNGRAARAGGPVPALASGALAAGAVSCLRTAALALAVSPAVGGQLWLPLCGAALALGLPALLPDRRAAQGHAATLPENPFELLAVLKLALLLAAVALVARLSAERLGAEAVLVVAALTGLADVDAVTLSVPQLVPASLTAAVAATAIGVAVATNIVAKAGYALVIGGARYALRLALPSAAALALGGALLLLW